MPESPSATDELARALRQGRLERGMSVRMLARRLGMSSHSGVSDYERGRRIPPEDLIAAYERVFELPAGELRALRSRAFAERATRADDPPAPVEPAPARRRPAPRTASLAAAALVLAAVGGIVVGLNLAGRQSSARPGPSASPSPSASRTDTSATALVARGAPTGLADVDTNGVVQPIRRYGAVTLLAGHVIDLDTLATAWDDTQAPRDNPWDLEFTLTRRSLYGIDNAVLGVLPPGSVGTRRECGLLQAYGTELSAAGIRPGALMCVSTDQHRYALLRVLDLRRDADGRPDEVWLEITVWEPRVAD